MTPQNLSASPASTAVETVRRIVTGEVTAREVTDAHIRRAEETCGELNHIVVKMFDEARRTADDLDAHRLRGEPLGKLHGVPVTIKEAFDVKGTPTTNGLTKHRDRIAGEDAPAVAALRAAGAVILGKTNVPQLCILAETTNPVYGRTVNPWDATRTPSGSSGGCAAAVASGCAAISLGSDAGGSIRMPAQACGVYGFMPTARRLTFRGHANFAAGQGGIYPQPGVLARSVEDLHLALSVLCDAPANKDDDPLVTPPPLQDPARVSVKDLRIAVCTTNNYFEPSPAFRRAVREAALALREQGAHIEDWTLPDIDDAMRIYFGLITADGMRSERRALRGSRVEPGIRLTNISSFLPHKLIAHTAPVYELFGQHHLARLARVIGRRTVEDYWRLIEDRDLYRERFLSAMDAQGFDAIISPPYPLPALRHGTSVLLSGAMSYTTLFNLLGFPAGVVPATTVERGMESARGTSRDLVERLAARTEEGSAGFPVGVQVAARHWREDIALAVMSALERHFRTRPRYPHAPPM